MMIDPPIDKLIKKAECRYALVCGVAKRARQLDAQYPELATIGLLLTIVIIPLTLGLRKFLEKVGPSDE